MNSIEEGCAAVILSLQNRAFVPLKQSLKRVKGVLLTEPSISAMMIVYTDKICRQISSNYLLYII